LVLRTYLVYNTVVRLQNNPPENNVEPVPAKSELPQKQSARNNVEVLVGNRFWFYILLMYLEYHNVVVLC
jgi:hypothetical protein